MCPLQIDDTMFWWPVVVASHGVGGGCVDFVPLFLVGACCAGVGAACQMVAMGPALAAHAARFCPQFPGAAAIPAATFVRVVLLVCKGYCQFGNGVAQHLQLRSHFCWGDINSMMLST